MIYQLKVELKYENPPVWRILEVDSGATFAQFHDVVEHAQQALLELVEQNGFRPREIWVTSKMKAMLAPLIKPSGLK